MFRNFLIDFLSYKFPFYHLGYCNIIIFSWSIILLNCRTRKYRLHYQQAETEVFFQRLPQLVCIVRDHLKHFYTERMLNAVINALLDTYCSSSLTFFS